MWTKDLQGWLWETLQEKNLVRTQWQLLVRIIQRMFKDVVVPEEVTWAKMVFLPKGREEYRGIGLVEIVWEVSAAVVNFRIKRCVSLYKAIHGFRAGGGSTGTANLEENLAQQLAGITNQPLFQVFLDVWKAY